MGQIIKFPRAKRRQSKKIDDFFVQKGLDELIPITENDFNNFKDIIYDKTYRAGYLIYLDGYYLFQPFDENEEVSMFYREHLPLSNTNMVSVENYVKQKFKNFFVVVIFLSSKSISSSKSSNFSLTKVSNNFIIINCLCFFQ